MMISTDGSIRRQGSFQLRDMNNWVDFALLWKLQLVGNLAHLLEYEIWAEVFVGQLVTGPPND